MPYPGLELFINVISWACSKSTVLKSFVVRPCPLPPPLTPNSVAPYLRKCGSLSIREILVITWLYARPTDHSSAPQRYPCKITQFTDMTPQATREIVWPPASCEAETTFETTCIEPTKTLNYSLCQQIWIIEKEKDRENETVGDRPGKLHEKKSDRELEREKKTKETLFVGRTTWKFCNGGEKMRNVIDHQDDNERQ